MKVVVAPDSFKGGPAAPDVARAFAEGWSHVSPVDVVSCVPQADGGEGTTGVIASSVPGAAWHEVGVVDGPDGRPVLARWLELPGSTAVVELAQVSGLPQMSRPDPLRASTRGLGQLILRVLEARPRRIVVCLGGSASTDGGAGALQALGARLLDVRGRDLEPGGGGLSSLHRVELHDLPEAPAGGVELLTDVDNPLLGEHGAAAVFGPQKGATADDVVRLDGSLRRLSELLGGEPQAPGAGAAGGVGYGLAAAWGAVAVPGAATIAELTGLAGELSGADVLISGEGRFDRTSLGGKVVGHALALASAAGVRAGIVAGAIADAGPKGIWTCSLTDLAGSEQESLRSPRRYLARAGVLAAARFHG